MSVESWTPVPILMYHAVEDAIRPPEYKHFYVTTKDLRRQMRELKARGYEAITLDALRQAQSGQAALPAKPIVLTFDDGYANLLPNMHPLLAEMGWPYTVYLVSERIGGKNVWVEPEGFEATPLLSRAQIREMQRYAGAHFEAHTATHPKLAELDPDRARREIVDGKDRLEQMLGKPVRHFCYPYGSYSETVVGLVRDAGFETATTTDFGRTRRGDDPLRLPRVSIYHVPPFSLSYGPGALNFRWRVESRVDKRPEA
jgi:peptidoglycan/xylan/chitin deacetylase (PgdA/CDA1 family)